MIPKKLKYFTSLIISFFFLIITYDKLDFKDIRFVDAIYKDNLTLTLIFISLFLPIHYLISYKFCILVNNITKITVLNSIKINLITYIYNLFLPAKAGDFLRFNFLEIKNVNIKKNFQINIFEKGISFFVLFTLICFSFFFIQDFLYIELFILLQKHIFISFVIFIIFISLSILIILVLNNKFDFYFNLKKIFSFFVIDFVTWLLIFIQIYICLKISNIHLNFYQTIFIFGLSILAGLIPISFGGFGIRDYAIATLLQPYAENNDVALLLIMFNIRYLLPIILGLILSYKLLNEKQS